MSTKPKVIKRLVALHLTKKSVPQLIADTKGYLQSMNANVHFPNPVPALATISADLATLEAAYALSQTHARGSVSKMHADVSVLRIALKSLANYVETVANADPEHAESIINTSGMPLKKPAARLPKVFSVKLGSIHGSVTLNTKAVKYGSYIYEMSTDPNLAELSWSFIYQGNKVRFTKTGLNSGTRYFFRVASIGKSGQSNWSPALTVVVQ